MIFGSKNLVLECRFGVTDLVIGHMMQRKIMCYRGRYARSSIITFTTGLKLKIISHLSPLYDNLSFPRFCQIVLERTTVMRDDNKDYFKEMF